MKIIVDKVPKKPVECLFAVYSGDGVHECKIDHYTCDLYCFNRKCYHLVGLEELEQWSMGSWSRAQLRVKED